MAFTYVPITGSWPGQTGKVVVTPVRSITNNNVNITGSQTFVLSGGSVSFSLAATDDIGTSFNTGYEFYLEISGQASQVFTTTIPHAQVYSGININTQLPWGYTPPTPSGAYVGVVTQTVQTVNATAGTNNIDCSQGRVAIVNLPNTASLVTLNLINPAASPYQTSVELKLVESGNASTQVALAATGGTVGAYSLTFTGTAGNIVTAVMETETAGASWEVYGASTVLGPANSVDPVTVTGCIMAVEVAAQPLNDAALVASSGGAATKLVDRSSAGNGLSAATTTGGTFHLTGLPSDGSASGANNPYSGGKPYLAIPSSAGDSFSVGSLTAFSDFALVIASYVPTASTEAAILGLYTGGGWGNWKIQSKAGAAWYVYDGSFHNFGGAFGWPAIATPPQYVISLSQGANAVNTTTEMTIRLNGIDVSSALAVSAANSYSGVYIGTTPTGGAAAAQDFVAAYLITPCPTIAVLKRIERWAAGQLSVPGPLAAIV